MSFPLVYVLLFLCCKVRGRLRNGPPGNFEFVSCFMAFTMAVLALALVLLSHSLSLALPSSLPGSSMVAPPVAARAALDIEVSAAALSSQMILGSFGGFVGDAADAAVECCEERERAIFMAATGAGHCVRPPDPGGTCAPAYLSPLPAIRLVRRLMASDRNASGLCAISLSSAAERAPLHSTSRVARSCAASSCAAQPALQPGVPKQCLAPTLQLDLKRHGNS